MIGYNLGTNRVAVLGLGEAGALLARDLVAGGAAVLGWDPDLHGDLDGIPIAGGFEAAVADAAIVLSVNWASVASDVARRAVPLLRPGRVFADLNTAGPARKAELAAIVEPSGAAFVDVAMMAPVPGLGLRVPMFFAGSGAQVLAAFLRPFGTPIEIVGSRPGEAAARKLTRSVFFKGMSAAVCEALAAARAAGVEDWLRDDIARTFAAADERLVQRLIDGTLKHALRRAHEMRDATALLEELGVTPTLSRATAEFLERTAAQQPGRAAPLRP